MDDDICQTLNERMGTGGGNVPLVLVVEDQGGAVIRWSADDVSPPLRAQEHGHQPLLVMDEDADRRCGESE